MKYTKWYIYLFIVLTIVYVTTYFSLSVQGQYEPEVFGIDHVKHYGWTPRGFCRPDGSINKSFVLFFYPLWRLDREYWHSSDSRTMEKYPVNWLFLSGDR